MKSRLALFSFLAALLFAAVSMTLPPRGKIDPSVLMWCAQLLVLCATFLGVESYVNIIKRMQK